MLSISTVVPTRKWGVVRRVRLHDRIASCRHLHGHVFLGRQHVAALGARHPSRPRRARHRPDGCSPGLLPAHHHRTGQHQQRAGAGVWCAHRLPRGCRVAVDHDQFERQHDAACRADEFAYAALTAFADRLPKWRISQPGVRMKTAVVSASLRDWLPKKPGWLDHQTAVGLTFAVKTFAASLLALYIAFWAGLD